MATSEKKILPVLYPLTHDMDKLWFIKYRVENFTTGNFVCKKYYGSLNLIADKEQRLKQAAIYIKMMQQGEELPNYQGMKRLIAQEQAKSFANAIHCCYKFIDDRRNEIQPLTASQYKSRVNVLAQWLQARQLSKMSIGGITKDNARDFLNYLKDEQKFSNKTYNEYKSLFGCIWEEYVSDGKIKLNPWRKIPALPEQTKHFESYPAHLREHIRKTLPDYDKQLWLFMQTIYYCAIRPHCELRLMKVKDLIVDKQRFRVRKEIAKGAFGKKRERVVNIFTGLFEQYIEQEYHQYPPEYYLFTSAGVPGEKPVRKNFFIDRWNAYKKQFDIPAIYKLYGSKHTGGKRLSFLFNEFVTKEHFGHSSMDSTKQYTEGIDKDELNILQTQYPEF